MPLPSALLGRPDVTWLHVVYSDSTRSLVLEQFECPVPSYNDLDTIASTISDLVLGGRTVDALGFTITRSRFDGPPTVTFMWCGSDATATDPVNVIVGEVLESGTVALD